MVKQSFMQKPNPPTVLPSVAEENKVEQLILFIKYFLSGIDENTREIEGVERGYARPLASELTTFAWVENADLWDNTSLNSLKELNQVLLQLKEEPHVMEFLKHYATEVQTRIKASKKIQMVAAINNIRDPKERSLLKEFENVYQGYDLEELRRIVKNCQS